MREASFSTQANYIILIGLLTIMNVFDIGATMAAVELHGIEAELNPLVRAIIERGGASLLTLSKAVPLGIFFYVIIFHFDRLNVFCRMGIVAAVGVYGVLTWYHIQHIVV